MGKVPKTTRIYSNEVISQIKETAENLKDWKPTWFICDTFRFGISKEAAIKEFICYIKRIVNETGAHIVPIAAIDIDKNGRVHIHAVLLTDRYIKNKAVHRNWKCGYEWSHLYKKNENGIPYILNHHEYIHFHKPFCPRKKKCRGSRGCRAMKTDWNIIEQAIEVSARGVPFVAAPFVVQSAQTPYKDISNSDYHRTGVSKAEVGTGLSNLAGLYGNLKQRTKEKKDIEK